MQRAIYYLMPVVLTVLSAPAGAGDLRSTNFVLRSGTVSASGQSPLVDERGAPAAASSTLGEAVVFHSSVGEDTGVRLASGFALATAGGAPDQDRDLVVDLLDNCPSAPNHEQADRGGLGTGSAPDGIGDACQCGDVTGDGRITLADAVALRRSLLQPPTETLAKPELCDVGGSTGCSLGDAVVIQRSLLIPPTAMVEQQCEAALP